MCIRDRPYTTRKVNVGAAENICKAVLAQPNKDDIKVCYIGTVAETGARNYPIHWGRCGDPLKVSIYDHYAISKIMAERVFVESGIKNWVVMRQTGILFTQIFHEMEPIMYHVPLNGMLEWCTLEDSGRLMCNFVLKDLPEDFYQRYYNIGSGEQYRLTNFEFEELLLGAIGLGSPKGLFDPNWFGTRNFHGQYYADSDILNDYLDSVSYTHLDVYKRQVYMFIDALARAGVENGMSKDMALEISAQAVYGSAKMILENLDTHPWKLIDMVCSPGGTTVEGVLSLQQNGFESAIHQAVNKAIDKDKKL